MASSPTTPRARPVTQPSYLRIVLQRTTSTSARRGEPIHQAQPVGGRMGRSYKLQNARDHDTWSAADERAYVKAFGKPSGEFVEENPTGCA